MLFRSIWYDPSVPGAITTNRAPTDPDWFDIYERVSHMRFGKSPFEETYIRFVTTIIHEFVHVAQNSRWFHDDDNEAGDELEAYRRELQAASDYGCNCFTFRDIINQASAYRPGLGDIQVLAT